MRVGRMPPVLTNNAVLMCNHGGKVQVLPRQMQVSVAGGFVICDPDLVGAPITGCQVKTTALTQPCTAVVETLPGSTSPTVMVAGRPVYVQTLVGVTNSRPPGTVEVVFPGQIIVQAP